MIEFQFQLDNFAQRYFDHYINIFECSWKKGDGGFKSLQKEIGGIQILVEIFQKKS